MTQELEIRVAPDELHDEAVHRQLIADKLRIAPTEIGSIVLRRRSLDARHGRIGYLLRFSVWTEGEAPSAPEPAFRPRDVRNAEPVAIVGAGPAGLFAALRLIELGFKPVIFERGKEVRERRRDIAKLTKEGLVNPDSNYCFGEGGAGTFSDGKLYTRAQKRGSVERILKLLVEHGAHPDILVEAHPHIGTNRLPAVVQAIRESIRASGGEVLFHRCVERISKNATGFESLSVRGGERFSSRAAILAAGHSARGIFRSLLEAGIAIERKPFAIGVRVEHPQPLINGIQYGRAAGSPHLPPAAYALKAQIASRGVFSFCMCPGGIICPAATSPGEVVVNGWSPSKRNSAYANSGIVVEVPQGELSEGPLSGLEYQSAIERRACEAAGGAQQAPAQRLRDFIDGRLSVNLPDTSYLPGTRSVNLHEILPPELATRLKGAFVTFGKQLDGYLTNEAVILAPESRTSSPVRIPRHRETLMHPEVPGLFPCGEGGGYAGGIVSAAMDGERVADAVAAFYSGRSCSK